VPPTTLDTRALNRATLARQFLLRRSNVKPLAVIERCFGMQAQVPRPPFVGLWTRLQKFERADLIRLIEKRHAVRGTMMRGTLHLMTAADYVTFRTTLQPLLTAGMQAIARGRGATIDADRVAAEAAAFFAAAPRTFEEVRQHLVTRFPDANDRVLGYAARMLVPLVMVPTDATWGFPSISQFTPAAAWIGKPLDERAHLPELVTRYLAAFGPAAAADVQTWSGLGGMRAVVDELRPKLRVFRDERGRELFDLPESERPPADEEAPVRFLPEYDNILLAHQDRRRIVADAHRKLVYLPGLRVAATFLVDGFVAGAWKVDVKKRTATLTLSPFGKLSKETRRVLEDEGGRLAGFLEPDAEDVDVRTGAGA
jgi:hypothetical protein